MYNFCILFDKNYLYRGLTLYFSLLKNSKNFHLWILCTDDVSFSMLSKMNLRNVSLITAVEFENKKLLAVKKERTISEYSWTLGANLCWYMMEKIKEGEMITYLDADMCFFDDPEIIFREIGNSSIAIVEHRLEREKKVLEKFVGTYNVAWVSFKKDLNGLSAAQWWKDRVLESCSANMQGGKIGDQHYLNDWTERFKNVCVIKNEGADVAPWNVTNRKISNRNGKIFIGEVPLVFYHFHNFALISKNFYLPAPASRIPFVAHYYIYRKYFKEMQSVFRKVSKVDNDFNYGFKDKFFKSLVGQVVLSFRFIDFLYIKYSYYKLKKTFK